MKQVYFEPVWKIHPCHHHLIYHPPDGYQFLVTEGLISKTARRVSKSNLSLPLMDLIYQAVPLNLVKSRLEGFFKTPPSAADLTYCAWHINFRKEPWVVELGSVLDPVGTYLKHVKHYRTLVENIFASEYCRKIICWSEHVRRTVLANLDCTRFEHKMHTVLPAIPRKHFTKSDDDSRVKLIFVGSAALAGEFEAKGGRELLEAFRILGEKYDNLELVIRSDIPRNLKRQYHGLKGLRLIEQVIPWEMLDEQYRTSDVFLMPAHYDPWATILEAMSYELPVIATDVYANREWVENGKEGLIIRKSEKVRHYQADGVTQSDPNSRFGKAARTTDSKVVAELVEKASILIENKELRRKMGKAGRRAVEHGRFSIENRNRVLKEVFDSALQR